MLVTLMLIDGSPNDFSAFAILEVHWFVALRYAGQAVDARVGVAATRDP
jgi:hypothetical protein